MRILLFILSAELFLGFIKPVFAISVKSCQLTMLDGVETNQVNINDYLIFTAVMRDFAPAEKVTFQVGNKTTGEKIVFKVSETEIQPNTTIQEKFFITIPGRYYAATTDPITANCQKDFTVVDPNPNSAYKPALLRYVPADPDNEANIRVLYNISPQTNLGLYHVYVQTLEKNFPLTRKEDTLASVDIGVIPEGSYKVKLFEDTQTGSTQIGNDITISVKAASPVAGAPTTGQTGTTGTTGTRGSTGGTPVTTGTSGKSFSNPIPGIKPLKDQIGSIFAGDLVKARITNLPGVISAFGNIAIYVAGFLMFFWLIWGGFQYIMAEGDKEKLARARGRMTWAIIGFLIVVVSFAISWYAEDIFPHPLDKLQKVDNPK